jgi:hypothetical protein
MLMTVLMVIGSFIVFALLCDAMCQWRMEAQHKRTMKKLREAVVKPERKPTPDNWWEMRSEPWHWR